MPGIRPSRNMVWYNHHSNQPIAQKLWSVLDELAEGETIVRFEPPPPLAKLEIPGSTEAIVSLFLASQFLSVLLSEAYKDSYRWLKEKLAGALSGGLEKDDGTPAVQVEALLGKNCFIRFQIPVGLPNPELELMIEKMFDQIKAYSADEASTIAAIESDGNRYYAGGHGWQVYRDHEFGGSEKKWTF